MSLRAAASAVVFIVIAGIAGAAGCKTPPKAGAVTSDAGADAAASTIGVGADAATAKPRDPTLAVVAEGTSGVSMFPTLDGRIVVLSGSTAYEAKPHGVLEPLLSSASLAQFHPDDDTFIGYVQASFAIHRVHGELGAPPYFLDGRADKAKSFAVKDGKLSSVGPYEARHVVRWRGKLLTANGWSTTNRLAWIDENTEAVPVVPKSISMITGMVVDADGALVVFGQESYEAPRAAIFPATYKSGDAATVVEAKKATTCSLLATFDASAVARCTGSGPKFYRISTKGFEPIFPDAPDDVHDASIGKDGALYVTFTRRLGVERCPAPAGKCTAIPLPSDLRLAGRASYETEYTDAVERKGEYEMGSRSWSTIRIEAAPAKETINRGHTILARSEDDIWLSANGSQRLVLLHSTDDPSRARVSLPSSLDGRIILKNENPPQPWTAHCEQVFVRLGAANADEIAKRVPEMQKALGAEPLAYESPFHWWLVEGRLQQDHAVGVVVVRRDVEESLDKMERAVERLIAAFSPNPMSKPAAYCTLPVLERRLHPAPSGT